PAKLPNKELFEAVVFDRPAPLPKNELKRPVVWVWRAFFPKRALLVPVVLLDPLFTPTKVLLKPATLSTRAPPMLYCVVALKTFALPLPLILKLLVVCALVEFWM